MSDSKYPKSLVILAAGMGSRYKGNKQIQPFGPNGETILDYSIYDAIKVGFTEVVMIIREDIEDVIKNHFLTRWENKIHFKFIIQNLDAFVEDEAIHKERTKPWGTAHALLCARDEVSHPFVIINADDYYGLNAFQLASETLNKQYQQEVYGLIVYELNNTISDHGSVNRGICTIHNNQLVGIEETLGISKMNDKIGYHSEEKELIILSPQTPVSMNFFYFSTHIFDFAYKYFKIFLTQSGNALKSEYFIPKLIQSIMDDQQKQVQTLQTNAKWFGVTYQEDNELVRQSIKQLTEQGVYPTNLT